jgi:hypothetical protein
MLGQVVGDLGSLPVVAATDAEHVRAAFIGQLGADRAGSDHEDPGRFVDLRGRDRRVRAPVPGDEGGAVADQFAGQCHRLVGVAGVVAYDQLDLLAEDAAVGVKVCNRQLRAALILLAEPGVGAGHRARDGDPDVRLRRPRPE